MLLGSDEDISKMIAIINNKFDEMNQQIAEYIKTDNGILYSRAFFHTHTQNRRTQKFVYEE